MAAPQQPGDVAASPVALAWEIGLASVGVLVALGALKHAGAFSPFIGEHAFTIAAALQLYVPILLAGRRGITLETLGLSFARAREDVKLVALLSLATIIPFALGHHAWQTVLFHRELRLRIPEGFLGEALIQVLVVALAEETFFRGYLQERMSRLWPSRRRLFGVPFGLAIILSSAVFALAHFVGEYRLDRLGPFFPALVFGLLRAKTGTIVGAVGYHAFCNLLAELLWASYRS